MPRWNPAEDWKGQDVFIIGGGPSLRGFDWNLLKGKKTIGCNSAYTLGHEVCRICFFSDTKWFYRFRTELEKFCGVVVTNNRVLPQNEEVSRIPWLYWIPRKGYGLHHDALTFGHSSGAAAINLALILGAQRVFLLGFDCKHQDPSKPNWHDQSIQRATPGAYHAFTKGFLHIRADLPKKFPGREIFNLGPDSALNVFPKLPLTSVLFKNENYARAS